jgi:dUTP pyrophosphatase
MQLKIKKLDKAMDVPKYAHEHDAAFDLPAAADMEIAPMQKVLVPTGLAMAIPEGHAGLIWDRSGLAAKHSLHVLAGVIDSEYRGEIKVVLVNLGRETFNVEKNMRIAQMLIQPVAHPQIVEGELKSTKRNEGGFGSTGLK